MTPYQYLNLENKWARFHLQGVVNEDGVLRLASVPGAGEAAGPILDAVGHLEGPAGIGVDADGNLYVADPAKQRIVRVDACDGSSAPLPCLRGPGHEPGQLNGPRGVLVGPRQTLYVADSGNHRVQVIDLATQQVRAIWGQPDPYAAPTAGSAPGRFDQPWDLAADGDGYIYVVDYGNRRLQKFDADGHVVPTFWQTVAASARPPQEPAAIAVAAPTALARAAATGEERLLVVDRAENAVLVYKLDGSYDAAATERWQEVAAHATAAVDVVAADGNLYVADAAGSVLAFDQTGTFLGVASTPLRSAAGLALDCQGRLMLHPGGGGAVQRLQPGTAYGTVGRFLAGPFTAGSADTRWHRVSIEAEAMPEGSHLQLFTYTSQEMDGEAGNRPGGPGESVVAPAPGESALDTWRPIPADALDFLVANAPGRYLWLAGVFQGDGKTTPAMTQIRVTYDHESWTRFLPAVHQRDAQNRAFLDPTLALFESVLADEATLIDDLPRLFDSWAAPDGPSAAAAPTSWLAWLSGWLAFELDETWPEAKRRAALAEAFSLSGRRGTVESLRRLIALYAGATAHIQEPGRRASLWSLGHYSTLGFDTMLVPAEAQGAVVGTTATLDRSHLIADEEYGAPLFEDVAHHFCVQVYAAELADPQTAERVAQVVEREKPAHTTYHLCSIGAAMRVGFQARLGIDTIVAGATPDLVTDSGQRLGVETALAQRASGPSLGQGMHLGRQTKLA